VSNKSKGTVKWFDETKGVGCIINQSGQNVSVDHHDIRLTGRKTLAPEQRVSYIELHDTNGLSAIDVQLREKPRVKKPIPRTSHRMSAASTRTISMGLFFITIFAVLLLAILFLIGNQVLQAIEHCGGIVSCLQRARI